MTRALGLRLGIVGASACAAACAALISIDDDLTFVPDEAGLVESGSDAPPPCTADVLNDPTNCGACGFVCTGGSCADGLCGGQLVAAQQDTPWALAVSGDSTYWLNRGQSGTATGAIMKCVASGGGACGPAEPIRQGLRAPSAFAVTDSHFFFIELGTSPVEVSRCDLANCDLTTTLLSSGDQTPLSVSAIGARGVWTSLGNGNGALRTSDGEDGGARALVASRQRPVAIVAKGTAESMALFWLEEGLAIFQCLVTSFDLGGCTPAMLPGTEGASVLAVDDTHVYFARGSNAAQILRVSRDGAGAAAELVRDQTDPVAIASDGTNFYWANRTGGTVRRCPVAGCGGPPMTLAAGQEQIAALALDTQSVYIATQGKLGPTGQIKRMPK